MKFSFKGPRCLVSYDNGTRIKHKNSPEKSIYDNTEYRLAFNKEPTHKETDENKNSPTKGRTVTKALLDKLAKGLFICINNL
jgi:hypothetical protein